MIVHSIVKEDGLIQAQVPKSMHGKKARIIIREESQSLSEWKSIQSILNRAKKLDIPRRRHSAILAEIRNERGSE